MTLWKLRVRQLFIAFGGDSMINVGDELIKDFFVGEMGIKTVAIGSDVIYTRPGGYLYLELDTKEED